MNGSFHAFGFQHWMALAILGVLAFLIVWTTRQFPTGVRRRVGYGLGVVLLAYMIVSYIRGGCLGILSCKESLPLHLCNWTMAVCIFTLFRPTPLGFELAYFWGMSGTLQALITPDLPAGFPSWSFIQFFWSHGGTLLSIVFMIAGLGLRPRPGSVGRMFIAVNVYALTAGICDALFGWNYGYLCHPPLRVSLMDYLGPWPWYILGLELIALVSFILLDAPWRWHRAALKERGSG